MEVIYHILLHICAKLYYMYIKASQDMEGGGGGAHSPQCYSALKSPVLIGLSTLTPKKRQITTLRTTIWINPTNSTIIANSLLFRGNSFESTVVVQGNYNPSLIILDVSKIFIFKPNVLQQSSRFLCFVVKKQILPYVDKISRGFNFADDENFQFRVGLISRLRPS